MCRVKIDIGNEEDSEWRIDVKKSNATPPKNMRKILQEYIPKVEVKGKNVLEHKAKKYSTDNTFDIWNPDKIKNKTTTFKLNRKNSLIKKIINSLEHGDEIVKEIEESVPYSLINLYLNDTQQKFQSISDPQKQEFIDRRKKFVSFDRESNIDDDTIKNMILKKAESQGIDLTADEINIIMQ